MNLKLTWSVLADTFSKWNEHKAIRLGAALAYFGIFAIAPVLIIAIAIAGLVYGRGGDRRQHCSLDQWGGREQHRAIRAGTDRERQSTGRGGDRRGGGYSRHRFQLDRFVLTAQRRAQHGLGSRSKTGLPPHGYAPETMPCPSRWYSGSGFSCWHRCCSRQA